MPITLPPLCCSSKSWPKPHPISRMRRLRLEVTALINACKRRSMSATDSFVRLVAPDNLRNSSHRKIFYRLCLHSLNRIEEIRRKSKMIWISHLNTSTTLNSQRWLHFNYPNWNQILPLLYWIQSQNYLQSDRAIGIVHHIRANQGTSTSLTFRNSVCDVLDHASWYIRSAPKSNLQIKR